MHARFRFHVVALRLGGLMEQHRSAYKVCFDKLLKFQQDTMALTAPSVLWPKFNVQRFSEEAQKTELRGIFVECTKEDVKVNLIMSRARCMLCSFLLPALCQGLEASCQAEGQAGPEANT